MFEPTLGNLADRATDRFKLAAPALAPVRRHENQLAADEVGLFKATAMQDGRVARTELLQCVDHRVPSYRASLDGKARPIQIGLRLRSRRQQDLGDRIDDLAVGLLWERVSQVAAAQPRLHMRNRDLRVKPCKRSGHCRGRVALDENEVRPAVCKTTAECPQQIASGIRQDPLIGSMSNSLSAVSPNAASAERQISPCCPEVTTRT